ncbi:MAG TPA: DUF1294 domain-containing protein [Oscillospiraceae bacterium]|nr:DUF1294 domain-containing protein [Oscillospiraceae bacterium]
MPNYEKFLLIYFILINLIAILATASDKRRAIKHKWRVPESTLLILSGLGGSISMLVTMRMIHHKTKRKKFMIGIPVIIFLQLMVAGAIFYFWR